jgi:hypothetical protein
VVHRCVKSRNLKNEEAIARVGLQCHKEKKICRVFAANRPMLLNNTDTAVSVPAYTVPTAILCTATL